MKLRFTILFSLLLSLFTSCEQELNDVLPGDAEDCRINFYTASDITETYATGAYTNVLFDKASISRCFTYIIWDTPGYGLTYPRKATNSAENFARFSAGEHTVSFTDTARVVVKELTADFPTKVYNCIYYTDGIAAQGGDPTYEVFVVQEALEPKAEQTGIRFVHAGADAGDLKIELIRKDGSSKAITDQLSFLSASDAAYYGSEDIGNNSTYVFRFTNVANNVDFAVGVPNTSSACYTVIIQGFRVPQQRTLYGKTVDVASNLRGVVRRMY